MLKPIQWNPEKNQLLKDTRGFGFEEVAAAMETGGLLDDRPHPNEAYSHQGIYFVAISGYVMMVPYVEEEDYIFLKTAYPSRKATKHYLKQVPDD